MLEALYVLSGVFWVFVFSLWLLNNEALAKSATACSPLVPHSQRPYLQKLKTNTDPTTIIVYPRFTATTITDTMCPNGDSAAVVYLAWIAPATNCNQGTDFQNTKKFVALFPIVTGGLMKNLFGRKVLD